jgi:hypothetical protein
VVVDSISEAVVESGVLGWQPLPQSGLFLLRAPPGIQGRLAS